MQQPYVSPLGGGIFGPGTALANSTSLTDISPAPQEALPAGFLSYVGARVRLKAFGSFSTSGTPTLAIGFYYGGVAGVALAATSATTTGSGASSWPWNADLLMEVRAIGSSGSVMCAGVVNLGTSLTALNTIPIPSSALSAVTIDTTTAKNLTVGAQWGTASASNTITCQVLSAESVY